MLKEGPHVIDGKKVVTYKSPNRGGKKICGFPVSSYKNLGRVGRF